MKVGLILGGGGEVGIAWELGVLAGLATHAGYDPATSHVIVGTSAGSFVGATVALGRDTTVDCATGATVLWDRSHGIDLARAVASSCAVPGWFPTVEHGGRRYTDAPRTEFCADVARSASLDAVLFVGPTIPMLGGLDERRELAALAADGLPVVQITGGAAFAEVGAELMNPAARPLAAEIGIVDGRAAARSVEELLS